MTVSREAVVAEARAWIGTPWQHQQRARGVAVDCGGLVIGVARTLGLVPPEWDITHYSRRPDGVSLLAACDAAMRRLPVVDIQPGDVIVLQPDEHPQHVAIVGDYVHGGLSMIHALDHADRRRAVVTEHRIRGRVVAAYALPGVA